MDAAGVAAVQAAVAGLQGAIQGGAAADGAEGGAAPLEVLEPAVLDLATLKVRLRAAAATMMPAIFKRGARESQFLHQEMGVVVPDWNEIRLAAQARALAAMPPALGQRSKGYKGRAQHQADRQPAQPPAQYQHHHYQGSGAVSGGAGGVSGNTHSSGGGGGGGGHHNNGTGTLGAGGGGVNSSLLMPGGGGGGGGGGASFPAPKLSRAVKGKANGAGRQYTSKFRGVHQTFPTKRWEAQFRRNGKPTSLGCFDHEEEAARAYDRMMLWCELHNTAGVKGGITNYDPSEYDAEIPRLQTITQDELIEQLRGDGRRQAAHRMLRQKRDAGPTSGRASKRANHGSRDQQQQQQHQHNSNNGSQQHAQQQDYGPGDGGEGLAAGHGGGYGARGGRRGSSVGAESGSQRGDGGSEGTESQV